MKVVLLFLVSFTLAADFEICDSTTSFSVSGLIEYIDSYVLETSSKNSLINFLDRYQNGSEYDNINPFMVYRRLVLTCQGFAWLFKDLNNLVWFYDKSTLNKYELAINAHAISDGSHWRMYLNDWKSMGFDNLNIVSSEVLNFFFGDFMKPSRNAMYKLIYLDGLVNGNNNPLGRFIIIRSLESAGTALFNKMKRMYKIFYDFSGMKLMYLGVSHFNLERGGLTDRTNLVKTVKDKKNYESKIDELFSEFNVTKEEFVKYKNVIQMTVNAIIIEHWNDMFDFVTNKWSKQNTYNNLL